MYYGPVVVYRRCSVNCARFVFAICQGVLLCWLNTWIAEITKLIFYHNLQRRVCATSAQKGKVDSLNENIAKANGGGAPSPKSASGLD